MAISDESTSWSMLKARIMMKLPRVGFILEALIYHLLHGKLPTISHISFSMERWLTMGHRGNKVVTDRARKKAKMVIRNWECGIVCSTDRLGFGKDSWNILKQFMVVEGAVPVMDVGKPWIREENDAP
jgi:hypothetical protein